VTEPTDFEDVTLEARAQALLEEQQYAVHLRTDRMLAGLMLLQWVVSIGVALVISPATWEGKTSAVHVHVQAAVFLGGAITSVPVLLAWFRPGWPVTRYVIASGQMLWAALLIHLTGGRIETHFLVFGSLAFISMYRDWKVFVPATVVIAADHLLRQIYWPESVFGIIAPEWWRWLEHAFYVVFEDTVLVMSCLAATKEMASLAHRQAELEMSQREEREKSRQLDEALAALTRSQVELVRTEKLAAVGKLAASVGHELRNPLAAIRSAHAYVSKKVEAGVDAREDARVAQFFGIMQREIDACSGIISDLLDFARERKLELRPCPLRDLVAEAIGVVPQDRGVVVENRVPEALPVPELDKAQFRQVFINLVQNAIEAVPKDRDGLVTVSAEGGGTSPWRIVVADNGSGIDEETCLEIFQPLFTTKTKGTGLGLAVVAGMVKRHGGEIAVESRVGEGTRFVIDLPATAGSAPSSPSHEESRPASSGAEG